MTSEALNELFDTKATLPHWAVETMHHTPIDVLRIHAYPAQALWQMLIGITLTDAAGVLPSGVLTDWRQRLVDSKATIDGLARAFGIKHPANDGDVPVPGRELFVCIIRIVYCHDEHAALELVKKIVAPAAKVAHDRNQHRLRALQNAGPFTRPVNRTTLVLANYKADNERTISQLRRQDNPYTLPEGYSLSLPPSTPTSIPTSQAQQPPKGQKRARELSSDGVAGPSRLPLALVQSRSWWSYLPRL
ncbi:hypothetical protein B0H16DRAFT_1692542 [Mycena metata]|uniref:Uncharacterized protein n=1 Tax=Mycena metata TaxID=1033252 RepID=A0AAD7IN52_9AGAR|nr:hypothetical protein B0H16DRAFT_1692542 [Mycena metata]